MAVAALIVVLILGGFALIPTERKARVVEASITWDYTTWLNVLFLILAGLFGWRAAQLNDITDREFNPRLAVNGHCLDARRVGSTGVWSSPGGMSPSALHPTPRVSTLIQVGDLVHATILTRARC
jgi:hypothetical protein